MPNPFLDVTVMLAVLGLVGSSVAGVVFVLKEVQKDRRLELERSTKTHEAFMATLKHTAETAESRAQSAEKRAERAERTSDEALGRLGEASEGLTVMAQAQTRMAEAVEKQAEFLSGLRCRNGESE